MRVIQPPPNTQLNQLEYLIGAYTTLYDIVSGIKQYTPPESANALDILLGKAPDISLLNKDNLGIERIVARITGQKEAAAEILDSAKQENTTWNPHDYINGSPAVSLAHMYFKNQVDRLSNNPSLQEPIYFSFIAVEVKNKDTSNMSLKVREYLTQIVINSIRTKDITPNPKGRLDDSINEPYSLKDGAIFGDNGNYLILIPSSAGKKVRERVTEAIQDAYILEDNTSLTPVELTTHATDYTVEIPSKVMLNPESNQLHLAFYFSDGLEGAVKKLNTPLLDARTLLNHPPSYQSGHGTAIYSVNNLSN